MIHCFKDSLEKSHSLDSLPIWEKTYRQAFPTFSAMINHRKDGPHQRAGIDRSVILENSKQILIDEKARLTDYGKKDIALEYLSDSKRNIPGWVCKPLMCDYIAYAILPANTCYLLPVVQLQSVWIKNRNDWLKKYFISKADNKNWTTLSCCVPRDVLFAQLGNELRVYF